MMFHSPGSLRPSFLLAAVLLLPLAALGEKVGPGSGNDIVDLPSSTNALGAYFKETRIETESLSAVLKEYDVSLFSNSQKKPFARLRLDEVPVRGQVAERRHPQFGAGTDLEIILRSGDRLHIELYDSLPFVLLRKVIRNKAEEELRIVSQQLPVLTLDVGGKPAGSLRVLGTGGLTSPAAARGSHAFSAVVDPSTRRGVVSGWLSHLRGSGVILPSVRENAVAVTPQVDYGRLILPPGSAEEGEYFAIGLFDDARLGLEACADAAARLLEIELPPALSGYCTWYSRPHGGASDETSIVELSAAAAETLKPFGLDFIQIDDRWQDSSRGAKGGPDHIFERVRPDGPYPGGMKPVADQIRADGFIPGLWYMPFAGWADHDYFADLREAFYHAPDGKPYTAKWAGTCFDMTHPKARDYLASITRRITDEWGYRYLKLDGLWTGLGVNHHYVNSHYVWDHLGATSVHDPSVPPVQSYRSGLELLRKTAGDDTFVLGCCTAQNMRSLGASFGLVDAMRVGPDNGPRLEKKNDALTRGPWASTNRYFLHNRIWFNDPDPTYVRNSMPIEHARLICSWIAVAGHLTVFSEWLPELQAERLDLLRRMLPAHRLDARPVDLFERELPREWCVSGETGGTGPTIIGLYNFDPKEPVTIRRAVKDYGLPEAGRYVGYEYWTDRFVSPGKELDWELAPGTCAVLALRPAAEHPQVVSTSRHITQGLIDLTEETWTDHTLSATSELVGGDPYEARIVAPKGMTARETRLQNAPSNAAISFNQEGSHVRVQITAPTSGPLRWQLVFHPNR